MAKAVVVFGPAGAGGRSAVNRGALEAIFSSPEARSRPVVVMTVVGPRAAGTSSLANAVLAAVAGAPTAAAFPCGAECEGAAGVAAWPALLPVRLPSGEPAGLLLMEAWGPLEARCPAPERAAALLLAAALSSVLVVQLDSADVGPLDDLGRLWELGAAAQRAHNCAPLQEVVFALRRWDGAAPAGLQGGFEPLHGWARQRCANGPALVTMQETSDWYRRAALFLAAYAAPSPAPDLVSFLATQRAVKRFNEVVSGGELAEYLLTLGACLERGVADGASVVTALVDGSQTLTAQKAEGVYEERMGAAQRAPHGPVSERNMRAAHDRAVHEARLAFMKASKMTGPEEPVSSALDTLLERLEAEYKIRSQMVLDEARRKEEDASARNADLEIRCLNQYKSAMESALDESPLIPFSALLKRHADNKQQALAAFDSGKDPFVSSAERHLSSLSSEMENLFPSIADTLEQRRVKAEDEALLAQSHAKNAEAHYRDIMAAVQPEKLRDIHAKVQYGALAVFNSLSDSIGDERGKAQIRQQIRTRTNQHFQALCLQMDDRAERTRRQLAYENSQQTAAKPKKNTYKYFPRF